MGFMRQLYPSPVTSRGRDQRHEFLLSDVHTSPFFRFRQRNDAYGVNRNSGILRIEAANIASLGFLDLFLAFLSI